MQLQLVKGVGARLFPGVRAMITRIGLVAGEILNFLDEKQRPVSITEIKLHLLEDMEVIHMSIGWLVRERYVRMAAKGNEQYLSF